VRSVRNEDLLGKDKTNHDGKWKVKVNPLKSGAYYAKVLRSERHGKGKTLICKSATSITAHIA
jgi:hypothetical protein